MYKLSILLANYPANLAYTLCKLTIFWQIFYFNILFKITHIKHDNITHEKIKLRKCLVFTFFFLDIMIQVWIRCQIYSAVLSACCCFIVCFLRFKIQDDIREHAGLSCGLVLYMTRCVSWSLWLRLHRNSFGFGEKRCSRHRCLLFCTCPESVIGLNQFIQSSPIQQHGISCSEVTEGSDTIWQ